MKHCVESVNTDVRSDLRTFWGFLGVFVVAGLVGREGEGQGQGQGGFSKGSRRRDATTLFHSTHLRTQVDRHTHTHNFACPSPEHLARSTPSFLSPSPFPFPLPPSVLLKKQTTTTAPDAEAGVANATRTKRALYYTYHLLNLYNKIGFNFNIIFTSFSFEK